MTSAFARDAYKNTRPTYVRIDKGKLPLIYPNKKNNDFSDGLAKLKDGNDLTIISTGIMVHKALEVAEILKKHSVSAGVIDLYRIKPINTKLLLKFIAKSKCIVTLEENVVVGGIGTIVSEVLSDNIKAIPLKRMAILDEHCFKAGNRDELHTLYNLDVDSITKTILKWI
jgi:transketolase